MPETGERVYSRDPEGQHRKDEHGQRIVFHVLAVDGDWVTLGSASLAGHDHCEGQHDADSLEPVVTVKPWLLRSVAGQEGA